MKMLTLLVAVVGGALIGGFVAHRVDENSPWPWFAIAGAVGGFLLGVGAMALVREPEQRNDRLEET
jgi:membrane associated rhomboid family serine protease